MNTTDRSTLSSAYLRFAADRQGNIWIAGVVRGCPLPTVRPVVAGSTQQDNLLTLHALQPARKGGSDLYVVKLAADGSGVLERLPVRSELGKDRSCVVAGFGEGLRRGGESFEKVLPNK